MIEKLVDFIDYFGCSLHQVNPIILRIGLSYRPEWMKKCRLLSQLPRWHQEAENLVSIPKRVSSVEIGARLVWTVENLQLGWKLTTEGFYFDDLSEAVYFKLRWP